MNERSKKMMERQHKAINEGLLHTFNLPVYIDEAGESESDVINSFHVVYGNFKKMNAAYKLLQEIYVVYITENNPDVEFDTVDIITTVSSVNGVEFTRTIKDRIQKDDTDSYIDQVTLIFNRKIAYEC